MFARSTPKGNSRASAGGTSRRYSSHTFFLSPCILTAKERSPRDFCVAAADFRLEAVTTRATPPANAQRPFGPPWFCLPGNISLAADMHASPSAFAQSDLSDGCYTLIMRRAALRAGCENVGVEVKLNFVMSKNSLTFAIANPRKDAGVVDRGGLENRYTLAGIQGSNPCLSATYQWIISLRLASESEAFFISADLGSPHCLPILSPSGYKIWINQK